MLTARLAITAVQADAADKMKPAVKGISIIAGSIALIIAAVWLEGLTFIERAAYIIPAIVYAMFLMSEHNTGKRHKESMDALKKILHHLEKMRGLH